MSVVWTVAATDQLQAIRDYLALTSPAYDQALAGRIVSRSESLDGQPLLGAEVTEYGDPDIREVFEHPPHPLPRQRSGRSDPRGRSLGPSVASTFSELRPARPRSTSTPEQ